MTDTVLRPGSWDALAGAAGTGAGAPHVSQKRAPCSSSVPQDPHRGASAVPQREQNSAPARFSCPHTPQLSCIATPATNRTPICTGVLLRPRRPGLLRTVAGTSPADFLSRLHALLSAEVAGVDIEAKSAIIASTLARLGSQEPLPTCR